AVRCSREDDKADRLSRGRIKNDRIDGVEKIPQTVRAAVDGIVAVGERRAARRIERDQKLGTVAAGEIGQALQLHFLDQSAAVGSVLGVSAQAHDLLLGEWRGTDGERNPAHRHSKSARTQHGQFRSRPLRSAAKSADKLAAKLTAKLTAKSADKAASRRARTGSIRLARHAPCQ